MMASVQANNRPRLEQLLPGLPLGRAGQIAVSGLTLDSRQVAPGDLFIALIGVSRDGREFLPEALARGAVAALVEVGDNWQGLSWQDSVPVIAVPELATQVSAIAGRFYGEPGRQLQLVGITGTNGKTTCSLLLAQLFALLKGQAAVVGTLGYGLLNGAEPLAPQLEKLRSTGLTTPDAVTLQRALAELASGAAQPGMLTAMEVSSHALVQGRVAALPFDTGLFTNLSRDHLDYHGDMDSYGRAKAQLLLVEELGRAIVNLDDSWAASLLSQLPAGVQGLSYSLDNPAADLYLKNRRTHMNGATATLVTPWGQGELRTSLLGAFNLGNLLAAIALAGDQGLPLTDILAVVPRLQPAPGRMQPVTADTVGADIQVLVDYAHTPDALEQALKALRGHTGGRLWCVFGCGGDRDPGKRPLMGALAQQLADCVIVTNDNPRSEDPAKIAADIVRGMDNADACLVVADRAMAIDLAVQQARPGDLVLIAGKGHENYQIFADETLPFSDLKQARLSLQKRLEKQEVQS